jgi:hypothetical protein
VEYFLKFFLSTMDHLITLGILHSKNTKNGRNRMDRYEEKKKGEVNYDTYNSSPSMCNNESV